MNVAVDDVKVLTENCPLRPYYAEPGTLEIACFMPSILGSLSNDDDNADDDNAEDDA